MNTDSQSTTNTRLRGRWLMLARTVWLVVAILSLGLFVAGIPAKFAELLVACPTTPCLSDQLRPAEPGALQDLGLSPGFYAAYGIALEVAFVVVHSAVAGLIFWRRSADRMALFVALALLTFGTATFPGSMYALAAAHPAWWPLVAVLNFLGSASFGLFLYLFPDGQFVPRWTRWVAFAWLAWQLPKYWISAWPLAFDIWSGWLSVVVWSGALGAVVYSQVYRYRRVSNRVQRQQTKWVVFGIAMALTGFLSLTLTLDVVAPVPDSAGSLLATLVGATLIYLAMLLIPLSIGIAMLRYHLFDIDLLINRTLVYGTLTACIIGLYVIGVGALSWLLQTQSNLAVSVLALLIVAAFVQPLRQGLQRGLNRLMRLEQNQPTDLSAALKLPETELSQPRKETLHIPMRPENAPNTTLRGRWLVIARVAWIVLAVVTLALFVASIPLVFDELRTVPLGEGASIWQLRPDEARALEQLGLSVGFYAVYWIVIQVVFVLGFVLVAGVIFWRKSDDWLALFVSLFLLMFGANTVTAVPVPPTTSAVWYLAYKFIQDLVFIFSPLFFLLFPDGQFVPRWTRPLAVGWIVFGLVKQWLPISAPPGDLMVLGLLGLGALAQIYRYRRVSSAAQRQQTKWVVFGFALTVAVFAGVQLLFVIFPWLRQPGAMLYRLPALTVILLSLLVLPLTIGMAILRYRLWDIDVIINRALVYGALSASIVGVYVLVVGFLGELFRASGNLVLSVLATGLVAMLFQPLRNRLQRGVNRLMYGERDDPYAVLSRLGQRLEATLAPEAVLPTLVETVKESLKLPYVAITLKLAEADTFAVVTSTGSPLAKPLTLPLVYQHETVGQLLLAPRAPGETFSPADLRLLDDLARQAGVAAHAVRLTTDLQRLTVDLQRSRERLVTTREEERRRLRRDLHDGLGPTLASLAQRLDTARILVARDPDAAVALLGDLKAQIKATITEIRRLVYGLRPPALDELGLVSAIREHVAHYDQPNGLHISIDAPEHMPLLPAAVEVAAYHIVLEALTNVARHANAQTCCIRLSLANGLYLEITDDGLGLPAGYRAGVGLTAMRERAAELGGECRIDSGPARGTRVWTWLPLPSLEV